MPVCFSARRMTKELVSPWSRKCLERTIDVLFLSSSSFSVHSSSDVCQEWWSCSIVRTVVFNSLRRSTTFNSFRSISKTSDEGEEIVRRCSLEPSNLNSMHRVDWKNSGDRCRMFSIGSRRSVMIWPWRNSPRRRVNGVELKFFVERPTTKSFGSRVSRAKSI